MYYYVRQLSHHKATTDALLLLIGWHVDSVLLWGWPLTTNRWNVYWLLRSWCTPFPFFFIESSLIGSWLCPLARVKLCTVLMVFSNVKNHTERWCLTAKVRYYPIKNANFNSSSFIGCLIGSQSSQSTTNNASNKKRGINPSIQQIQ